MSETDKRWAEEMKEQQRIARAEIERLKAELSRLTPSGQVAEDVQLVADGLGTTPRIIPRNDVWLPALSRLAAKAQERDAAVADNAAWLDLTQRIRNLLLFPTMGLEETRKEVLRITLPHVQAPHPGVAILKERQEREETVMALAARLGARVAPGVAPCMCYLTAPERCNNCEDRDLVAKVLP